MDRDRPRVGRYQCSSKWNSNFWLLCSWNNWHQLGFEQKISIEELLGKHNTGGTCLKKKVPPQIYKIQENITNSLFGQKNQNLWKTWKQMHLFNLYVWSAFCNDFSKVWKMKFRLWHVILSKIANLSLGQKNLKSCQIKVLEKILSSPLTLPILLNIKPYQKYTKNT